MEEIRVYHSLWKNILVVIVSFAFTCIGFLTLQDDKMQIMSWLGILFFGLGGLFMLYVVLRERIAHIPYYVITDEKVFVNSGGKKWEVRFADVEEFFMTTVVKTKMIGIRYKKDIEFQKMEEANLGNRTLRKMNMKIAGTQEALPADDLTIKPQQFLDLLNERLNR